MAACATEGTPNTTFDASAGEVEVCVLGDGFVRADGERVPLDAIILTLRQRVRQMPKAELGRFVVQVTVPPRVADTAVLQRRDHDLNRLLNELEIMGVKQVRYL